MIRRIACFIFVVFICILAVMPVVSAASYRNPERILMFNSDITVHEDSSMTVTETIKVRSATLEIKRGIYRDFPTRYRDRYGNPYTVGFRVIEVLRDGIPEAYHIKGISNGKRIYTGREDVYLPRGEYTYTITYKTNRQLGFFEEHDELYWNVTGNGWIFPIDVASATIRLPEGITKDRIILDGYTGVQGSKEKNFSVSTDDAGNITFVTTSPLNSFEGLTIVAGWPKGFVKQPTAWMNIQYFMWDNLCIIFAVLGFLFVFIYYLYMWNKVGRDPPRGTIIPLYEPPAGLSPAAVRYIRRMEFDSKVLVAAIINMAVKRFVKISEEGKVYTVSKDQTDESSLSFEEKEIAMVMPDSVVLKNENYADVQAMRGALKDKLQESYEKVYFVTNAPKLIVGVIFSVAVMALSVFPFVDNISFLQGVVLGITFVLLIITNGVFYRLLKAPTEKGKEIMDQIEGFRMFLSITEKERLNLLNPPEKTPELFEKYLPYALALGVEQRWSEQFSNVFERMANEGRPYAPVWYYGAGWHTFGAPAFASSLSRSFSGAISSSAVPPGSRSGFGGGGSGGGGGGGGGGGW